MTGHDERPDPVQGLHRVRIIPPDTPGSAPAMAYSVEVDGHPIYPSSLEVCFESQRFPKVTLTFPAIIENTQVLAWLTAHPSVLGQPQPADTLTGDADEPLLGCREGC